ncbi:MAG: hypothetical protein GX616_27085 [Planctomycetes bacterium]|nr:hypothetical protein [Planctomycetota bacterium]
MRRYTLLASLVLSLAAANAPARAREWTDKTGTYSIEAELFGYDDENVILQREDGDLGMFKRDELSAADREYLTSKEAVEINDKNLQCNQAWTTASGLTLAGRVVDYFRDEITVQRRRGRMYVNDRVFGNLPELYQKLLPEVIEHFDGVQIPDDGALRQWLLSLGGRPRTFLIEGVILEWENGDEYAIPFFVFSEQDRAWLMQGWAEWLAVQRDHEERADLSFRLQAHAAARLKNQQLSHQIALMNLNLQAIQAGLTSAWEVTLHPVMGNPRPPRWVVVLGRDSREATFAALQQNPGYTAGPVRRISH